MTEQDLINQMVTLTSSASSILANIQTYATVNTNVTFIVGATAVTVPSIPAQVASNAVQQLADRANFHKDFGGAVASEVVTRDSTTGKITGVAVTFSSGWGMTHTYTRNVAGNIATISVVVTDNFGATQSTLTKTVAYDSKSRFSSLS